MTIGSVSQFTPIDMGLALVLVASWFVGFFALYWFFPINLLVMVARWVGNS